MRQTEKYWNLINWIVLAGIVVMAGIGVALMFGPKVRQMRDYQATNRLRQEEIDKTLAKINQYREQNRRFQNDREYVEKIAHEQGFARADEIIYEFPDAEEER